MMGDLQKAKRCEIYKKDDRLFFCTGLVLSKSDLRDFKNMNLKTCRRFIEKIGFKTTTKKPDNLTSKDWREFQNSTQLAMVFHTIGTVAFKPQAKREECIHEVLHIYQRSRQGQSEFNPIRRKSIELSFLSKLEKVVAVVETLEKQGKIKEAKELGNQLSAFIEVLGEYRKMINWLDEKEIYAFFYLFGDEINQSVRSKDIALSNLVKLKSFLSWRERDFFLREAQIVLNQKFEEFGKLKVKDPAKSLADLNVKLGRYSRDFSSGKLTRENFEALSVSTKVDWYRKQLLKEKDQLKRFEFLAKMRKFESPGKGQFDRSKIKYQINQDLPMVKIKNFLFIIDTGAMENTVSTKFFLSFKNSKDKLFGSKLVNFHNKLMDAFSVEFSNSIPLQGGLIKNFQAQIVDLPIKGVDGILGLPFLKLLSPFYWDFKKNIITKTKIGEKKALNLLKNKSGQVVAIEWACPEQEEFKIRFDTGSQFNGEVGGELLDLNSKKFFAKKSFYQCGPYSLKGPFDVIYKSSNIFDHDVSMNLGFPARKNFKGMYVDLEKGLFSFRP